MAQLIKIKRSTVTAAPGSLENGELAYSANSNTLFIGRPGGGVGDIDAIGGKVFADKLDHTNGVLTINSAIVTDAANKIDQINVDNLRLDGNTVSSTDAGGDLILTPDTTGDLILDGQKWPQNSGLADEFLKTDALGQLSWAAIPSGSFTISDGTNNDVFSTGETLTFTGGTGITTLVTDNEITFTSSVVNTDTDVSVANLQTRLGEIATPTTVGANTSADVTFAGNVVLQGELQGPATLVIDPAGIGDNTGTVVIAGDLTVQGTTTSVDSNTVEIGDSILLLNKDEAGVPSQSAGFEVERGTSANVQLLWNETTDKFVVTNDPDGSPTLTPLLTVANFESEITTIDGGTY